MSNFEVRLNARSGHPAGNVAKYLEEYSTQGGDGCYYTFTAIRRFKGGYILPNNTIIFGVYNGDAHGFGSFTIKRGMTAPQMSQKIKEIEAENV